MSDSLLPIPTRPTKAEFDAHTSDTSNPHEVTAAQAGAISTADGAVGTDNLADASVTTDKIKDAAVTAAKLASMSKAELLVVLTNLLDVAGGVPTLNDDKELEVDGITPTHGDSSGTSDADVAFAEYVPAEGEEVNDLEGGTTYKKKIGDGTTTVANLAGRLDNVAKLDELNVFTDSQRVAGSLLIDCKDQIRSFEVRQDQGGPFGSPIFYVALATGQIPQVGFFGVAVQQQTITTASAGATYTAAEQAQLQSIYDALVAYGLLKET